VNDFSADAIISQLLLLDAQDSSKVRQCATLRFVLIARSLWEQHRFSGTPKWPYEATAWLTNFPTTLQDIKLFINSPGGSVTAGMGIYDAMQVR
jgi:hypothetical protein